MNTERGRAGERSGVSFTVPTVRPAGTGFPRRTLGISGRILNRTLTEDKVMEFAIVTGAGSGIGRALAIELSRTSIPVIAVGRRTSPLQETASLAQGTVRVVSADIGKVEDYLKISSEITRGVSIKYLIHTAGTCPVESTLDITPESWNRTMATNLNGRLFLTLHLLPRMESGSRILFVGSNSATTPRKGCAAYCASKAASHMLQECLKLELADKGILVGSAIPSPVHTPLLDAQMDADPTLFPDGEEYRKLLQEGRLIQPKTVAKFYRWLLTDVAAKDYTASEWNIQDDSHHRYWLGGESIFQPKQKI